jgi:hypothetical protein
MVTIHQCLLFETGGTPAIFASLRGLCGLAVNSSHLVAECALSGIGKPIGIAEYQLVRALPEPLDTCPASRKSKPSWDASGEKS